MRTTITIDDDLFERAAELTGIHERSVLVREAVETHVGVESGRRLARLGGTDPGDQAGRRRREEPA